MASEQTPFHMPGFTVPLDPLPRSYFERLDLFRVALDSDDIQGGYCAYIFTTRELLMMHVMDAITDKPEWERKIFDNDITNKWFDEILMSGADMTPAMMEYVIAELEWKAAEFKKTGIVMSFDPGVVKSDTAIPEDIRQKLQAAVKPLEDVPEEERDYHPRSDNKVIDLVHPSLFPFIYGRTRVLRDTLIGKDDCFNSVGQGEIVDVVNRAQRYNPDLAHLGNWSHSVLKPYSERFQWLPCDVQFDSNGNCKISSYINNLHPAKHRELYGVIEKVITRAVPLWNASLSRDRDIPRRIPYTTAEYPSDEEEEPEPEGDDYDDPVFEERYRVWEEKRQPKQPEPGEFEPPSVPERNRVDLHEKFGASGLQVIVKLANIQLSPEKPEYGGGSWHIEGQLNERICATAIYYYDSHNITTSTLGFRHRADEEYVRDVTYEQGQFEFVKVFGFTSHAAIDDHDEITQHLGDINTRQGRLLTFPNTLQHRVSPFELADKSKRGHRKILALFLIDPHRRIISTANVPPQREDWCTEWKDAVRDSLAKLPVELQDMIHRDSETVSMTMDEAKAHRLELMDERSVQETEFNKGFQEGGFSLCEH